MSASPVPVMTVVDALPQELVIEVVGADVALLGCNRPQTAPAPDDAIPDPVELLVACANQQMFPRAGDARCASSAKLLERKADLARGAQTWRVQLADVDLGCLKVLANLLSARDLDAVTVKGTSLAPNARALDVSRAAYPSLMHDLPFAVEREDVIRSLRDRLIQVEFPAPPPDNVVDSISAVMDLWCELLLLGGYPPADLPACEAGVMPEGPLLLDEVTVQLAFPDVFQADELAFHALANHIACFARRVAPIALVRIR